MRFPKQKEYRWVTYEITPDEYRTQFWYIIWRKWDIFETKDSEYQITKYKAEKLCKQRIDKMIDEWE